MRQAEPGASAAPPAQGAGGPSVWQTYGKEMALAGLLAVLCTALAIASPQFLSPINLQNTGRLIGMYGILGIGVAVVIVTGGIDLSVGSLCALLGVLLAMGLVDWGQPPWLVLPGILLLGGIAGWLHGLLISRLKVQPFIVTLCGLLLYRGAARFITNDETKGFGEAKGFEGIRAFATGDFLGVPATFWVFLAVAAAAALLLHKTVYGRRLYALGKNPEAARYAGVDVLKTEAGAYVFAGGCTALAAILFAFYTNSIAPSSHGSFYELYGIAAAVLGGFSLRGGEGTVWGVILGTALLQVLQNLVNLLGIPSSLNFAVMGLVILVGALAERLWASRREA